MAQDKREEMGYKNLEDAKIIEKRFGNYDEAMGYLNYIFNLCGFWQARLAWSERTEFEERPYSLIIFNPNENLIRAVKREAQEDKLEA